MPAQERPIRDLLRDRWDVLLVISAGGALGSLGRWGAGELLPWRGPGFPWATFWVNLSGAFALGLLMVLVLEAWPPSRYVRPFVGVGLLGGYTTFSAYALETRELLADGELPTALAYLFGSLTAVLLVVWLGIAIARAAVRDSRGRRRRRRSSAPHPDREEQTPRSTR